MLKSVVCTGCTYLFLMHRFVINLSIGVFFIEKATKLELKNEYKTLKIKYHELEVIGLPSL